MTSRYRTNDGSHHQVHQFLQDEPPSYMREVSLSHPSNNSPITTNPKIAAAAGHKTVGSDSSSSRSSLSTRTLGDKQSNINQGSLSRSSPNDDKHDGRSEEKPRYSSHRKIAYSDREHGNNNSPSHAVGELKPTDVSSSVAIHEFGLSNDDSKESSSNDSIMEALEESRKSRKKGLLLLLLLILLFIFGGGAAAVWYFLLRSDDSSNDNDYAQIYSLNIQEKPSISRSLLLSRALPVTWASANNNNNNPTSAPSTAPTKVPTDEPSSKPTLMPSITKRPSWEPPSLEPTDEFPTKSSRPTLTPSPSEIEPTGFPTKSSRPTLTPTASMEPTGFPTESRTSRPSLIPTQSMEPTGFPTDSHTSRPSLIPTPSTPTEVPTESPTSLPTLIPTPSTMEPTTPRPTMMMNPTRLRLPVSKKPISISRAPTKSPIRPPSHAPTKSPIRPPSHAPTKSPSLSPSLFPTESAPPSRDPGKIHVYILAGQSNMQGHGVIDKRDENTGLPMNGTLLYQLHDPRTKEEFEILWDESKNDWKTLGNVQIWSQQALQETGIGGTRIPGVKGLDYSAGDLTVGYGKRGPAWGRFFGPELGFGFHLELPPGSSSPNDKILLIKSAWGGKDLAQDFRPPSSAQKFDPFCWLPKCDPFSVGHYYDVMLRDINKLLQPGILSTIFPNKYETEMTVDIAGFGWFQGWNDGSSKNYTAAYESNLVHLIQDLRNALKKPRLPVVIGVSGFEGYRDNGQGRVPANCWDGPNIIDRIHCNCTGIDRDCRRIGIMLSQIAAANLTKYPELECCVEAIETRDFFRPAEFSPMNAGYHFHHNAETHYLIGKAMAQGMNRLQKASVS